MSGAPLELARATASDAPALSALFERAGVACHCRYWQFSGDKNAWQERLALAPAENAREFTAELERETRLVGVVARSAGKAVGWMRVAPAETLAKLYAQRLYKGLPCFGGERAGTYTVGCLLVDPEQRRMGVARELLRFAVELCRSLGAARIEAFPRRGEPLTEPELWLGPYPLFVDAGFVVVHEFAPYPVLRLELTQG